ncbi:ketopantoate reductase PanE/ApbA-domain-containing protein [Cadophora sp. MPI-SDFR-AT-0126]|nr:ketopantoate reductase PanE/ApbA-domain-containing protein [Leotiomycetes sp. MPI-SDFR-AT-0126]
MSTTKSNVLLVGSGGVGTMAAYNLEAGGLATVTAVLRSNFKAVSENGFTITSVDHGEIKGWKPAKIVNVIPTVGKDTTPFDFIVVTTKNVADVHPTVAELIAPAVTEGHTAIALLQNGLNIEKPVIAAFPKNPVLSGVSLIGATETSHSHVLHDDPDELIVSPYLNPNISAEVSKAAAKKFARLYSASGKVDCEYNENVGFVRWRKLVYNACYNSACAVVRMDTSRMRMYKFPIDDVVRPLMVEIIAIAKAAGYELPEGIADKMINADPEFTFFKPSMQQDIEKGNFIEFENIVGEPLRESERLGVPAPNLRMIYGLLKILQWKNMEIKGLVKLPVDPPVA